MKKISKKKLNKIKLAEVFKLARERDNYECVICGSTKRLNCHHVISAKLLSTRYLLDNIVTLCARHHRLDHHISGHCGSYLFIIWLQNNRAEQLKRLEEYRINNLKEIHVKS